MDQGEFDRVVQKTIGSIQGLLAVKGGEYAGSDDRLANFKRGASLTGCTPLQVAFIYASKHFDGIASYVKDPTRKSSEPIEGRFDDLINYCILMKAIVLEMRVEALVEEGGKGLKVNWPGGVAEMKDISQHFAPASPDLMGGPHGSWDKS